MFETNSRVLFTASLSRLRRHAIDGDCDHSSGGTQIDSNSRHFDSAARYSGKGRLTQHYALFGIHALGTVLNPAVQLSVKNSESQGMQREWGFNLTVLRNSLIQKIVKFGEEHV